MEFVERLTQKKVEEFANILKSLMEVKERLIVFQKDYCRYLISRDANPWNAKEEKGGWVIGIYFKYAKQYNVTIRIGDYDIIAYQVGNLSTETIKKQYLQFMYREFGEEYKKAYMIEAAKILDE